MHNGVHSVSAFFEAFSTVLQLWGVAHSPPASLIIIHRKVHQAKGCCPKQCGFFSLLIKWRAVCLCSILYCFVIFIPLYTALDESKMKLVTLSGSWKGLDSHSGRVEIGFRKYSCVCVCVAVVCVVFSHTHPNTETPDVLPRFYSELPQERAEPPAGWVLVPHDLQYLYKDPSAAVVNETYITCVRWRCGSAFSVGRTGLYLQVGFDKGSLLCIIKLESLWSLSCTASCSPLTHVFCLENKPFSLFFV